MPGTPPAETGTPADAVGTKPGVIGSGKRLSSVLAKFVWGYVLIMMLGLKIAREKFVWLAPSGSAAPPAAESATTGNPFPGSADHPLDSKPGT